METAHRSAVEFLTEKYPNLVGSIEFDRMVIQVMVAERIADAITYR